MSPSFVSSISDQPLVAYWGSSEGVKK